MAVERREIVVIGAGPAGSAAAREAALAGLCPLLIEKDDTPGAGNACGGVAAHGYGRGLQLTDDVVEREIRRTVLSIDGTRVELNSARPTHISFRRNIFDAFLARRAVRVGAELLTSTRVTSVDPASRRIKLKNQVTGREHEVVAQTIIFADGPATLAAESFGIGHRPGRNTIHGVFVELEGAYGDGETMDFVVDTSARNKGYFWIFPKKDLVQVGVGGVLLGGAVPFQEQLARFIRGRHDLRERRRLRKGAGLVPAERSDRLVANGAMVVGDAAGLANPLTGGGVGAALVSGEIAGRVAAAAHTAGRSDSGALLRYPRRLRTTPHCLWLSATAYWYRRLDRMDPAAQPAAYAQKLRHFFSFYHSMRSLVDILLR